MAQKKNIKTGKSKSAKSGQTSSARSKKALEEKRRREEALRKSQARRRVASVILFAVGLLISLLVIIPGGEGWFAIHSVVLGLFGIPALTVGIFTIASALMISTDMTKAQIRSNIIFLVIIQLVACAAFEIFPRDKLVGDDFGQIVSNLYQNGSDFAGGGFFALILGVPLLLLGKTGAVIAIIIIMLVMILLLIKIPLAEMFKRIGSGAQNVGKKTADKIKTHREESAVANEEYRRIQAERRAEREIQKQIELNEKQRRIESLKNIKSSVGMDVAETKEPRKTVSPVKLPPNRDNSRLVEAQTEDSKKFRSFLDKYRGKPEKSEAEYVQTPEMPGDFSEHTQDEQIRDYREPLKKYMEKKHPILQKPYEPNADSFVDNDADLVPLAEALEKLNSEKSPARVSKIVDAPVSDRISSDAKPSVISDSDEAELELDFEDISYERTKSNSTSFTQPIREQTVQNISSGNTERRQPTLSEVYMIPPVTLLDEAKKAVKPDDVEQEIRLNADKLVNTLKSFGVSASYMGAARGPSVTRYELQPAPGVKLSKIAGLADDIALNLAVSGIRIAPVPDKAAVGIEIPNKIRDTVFFRELIDTESFKKTFSDKLDTVLGKDISGEAVRCNVSKMPHLLIAGTTGSGKSVCVNSIIMSILMKSTPSDVRLIMVDPKQVEFMMYNGIPHLLIPVVTDPKKAAGALAWSVTEMDNRYTLFSENNVRNIDGYNELIEKGLIEGELMPRIVIFIDELADLMMASPKDVEDSIVRLAQKARAAGMHLVIATQKPTVQVVTGLIKGNIPSRIALMVASQIDSRVILDASGAEKLLGNGDMLYMPVGVPKPIRLQGCYVSDEEVERVVDFIKQTFSAEYDENIIAEIERRAEQAEQQSGGGSEDLDDGETDEKLEEAIEFVVTAGQASTSALQRRLKLGYGRAARLIDTMEKMGIVGAFEGSKPRQVLMTKQEWYERKLRNE